MLKKSHKKWITLNKNVWEVFEKKKKKSQENRPLAENWRDRESKCCPVRASQAHNQNTANLTNIEGALFLLST